MTRLCAALRATSRARLRAALAALLLVAAAFPAGAAPTSIDMRDADPFAWTGPSWHQWDIEPSSGSGAITLSQFWLPATLTVPFGERFDLVWFGAFSMNELTRPGIDAATLDGITDFRLKGAWRPGGRLLVTAGVGLPAGHETLRQGLLPDEGDEEFREVEVAQFLWAPILGLPSKRMGEGLTAEAAVGWAAPLSPTATLGLGAGAVLKQEYDLFQTTGGFTAYDPGEELSASVGLDLRPAAGTLLRVDLAVRAWGDDQVDQVKSFRAGPQVEFDAGWFGAPGDWSYGLEGRAVLRGDDETIDESGADVIRTKVSGGDALFGRAQLYRRAGARLSVGLELEAASFGESGALLSDGTTVAIGPGLRFGRSGGARGEISARYRAGDAEDGEVDLSGFDVGAALRVEF